MNDKYLTVSDLNKHVKNLVEKDSFLNKIYLKGEISNFKFHSSGHLYFSLKDEDSKINAVMFEFNRLRGLDFEPTDGMNVLIEGKVDVYVPNGAYQIYVEKMTQDGLGNLYIEYEKLKKKLEQEGLFALDHKKSIPEFPEKIGIITASTGAAIKDILSTIKRRYPICKTILFPTLVQGDGAKENIVKQLKAANAYDLDVIILGRGGGSIEDLWAFNEEIVARAIYDSKIPIISAVGHDIDFTISDFVADLRAATPTGGAELAVPNITDLKALIKQYKIRSLGAINNYLNNYLNRLKALKESYILKNPMALYEIKEQKLSGYIDRLNNYMNNLLDKFQFNYKIILNKITLLNPLNILEKGYGVISKDNKIIKSAKELSKDDELIIKLYEGKLKASVKEIL